MGFPMETTSGVSYGRSLWGSLGGVSYGDSDVGSGSPRIQMVIPMEFPIVVSSIGCPMVVPMVVPMGVPMGTRVPLGAHIWFLCFSCSQARAARAQVPAIAQLAVADGAGGRRKPENTGPPSAVA